MPFGTTVLCLVVGVGLLAACHSDNALDQHPNSGAVVATLPQLVPMPLSLSAETAPYSKAQLLADGAGGLYYFGEADGPAWITRLDSTGRLRAQFGRSGAGPGELSGLGILFGSSDSLFVVDTRRSAVVRFGPDGNALGDTPIPALRFPLAIDGGELYSFDQTAVLRGLAPAITAQRLSGHSEEERVVLDGADSIFARAVAMQPGQQPPIPAFAVHQGMLVIGDPRTGEIAVRDNGRRYTVHIPGGPPARGPQATAVLRAALESQRHPAAPGGSALPADPGVVARLDTLDREMLPYFAWPGLIIDDQERLWVASEGNDSTAFHIFVADSLIGRLAVPCRQPGKVISLQGRWLALQCRLDGEVNVPYQLQLYRIED